MLSLSLNGLGELYRLAGPLRRCRAALQAGRGDPGEGTRAGVSRYRASVSRGWPTFTPMNAAMVTAEALYRRVLTIQEKALGPRHPSIAPSLNNLAEVYRRQDRYADAAAALRASRGGLRDGVRAGLPRPGCAAEQSRPRLHRPGSPGGGRVALQARARDQAESPGAGPFRNRREPQQSRAAIREAGPLQPTPNRSSNARWRSSRKRLGPTIPTSGSASTIWRSSTICKAAMPTHCRLPEQRPNVDLSRVRPICRHSMVRYTAGSVAAADAVGESFSVAQQASSSAASAALGQLAVTLRCRIGRTSRDWCAASRTSQSPNDRLDKAMIAEISKAPADRNNDKEQALRDELEKTTKALSRVRGGTRFTISPTMSHFPGRRCIELADAQALLGEDEALVVIDLARRTRRRRRLCLGSDPQCGRLEKARHQEGRDRRRGRHSPLGLDPTATSPSTPSSPTGFTEQTFGTVEDVISRQAPTAHGPERRVDQPAAAGADHCRSGREDPEVISIG